MTLYTDFYLGSDSGLVILVQREITVSRSSCYDLDDTLLLQFYETVKDIPPHTLIVGKILLV